MDAKNGTILITGASGNTGRKVLEALLQASPGIPVGALYRSAKDAAEAPAGVSAVIADFADPASLVPALAGVGTVFLVCAPVRELIALESNAIDACVAAGVGHVVLNSALGAGDYPKSFPSWHRVVEDKLRASGLAYTIFRPNSFHQNVLAYLAPSIRSGGAFYAAAGDARYAYIDLRDIAAAMVTALLSPAAHAGRTYALNGPEAITNTELAARISKAAGRTVIYVDIPEAAQREGMLGAGMPEWQVDALLDLQRYYIEGKGGDGVGVLPELIGREPIGIDRFLTEFGDAFQPVTQAGNPGR